MGGASVHPNMGGASVRPNMGEASVRPNMGGASLGGAAGRVVGGWPAPGESPVEAAVQLYYGSTCRIRLWEGGREGEIGKEGKQEVRGGIG